ncbi:hypothetical protein M9458_035145, partial [Cirrhinus mrigala]
RWSPIPRTSPATYIILKSTRAALRYRHTISAVYPVVRRRLALRYIITSFISREIVVFR